MSQFITKKEKLSQLEDALQSPTIALELDDPASTKSKVRELLKTSKHCCIIVATSESNNKLRNIKTLYYSLIMLRKLRKKFDNEYSLSSTSLLGIYPSLQYPVCIYELHTNADRYISANVLPHDTSALMGTIKYLTKRLLGASPSIGGLGLILYRK